MAVEEPLLIWGAGAIGGTIGAALVRAGHAVLFVDNAADHVARINQQGLTISGSTMLVAVLTLWATSRS